MTPGAWSRFHSRFLSWRYGREVMSPFCSLPNKVERDYSEDMEQRPMRFADTGEPVRAAPAPEPEEQP